MRRIIITAVATTALALPGVALAHAGRAPARRGSARRARHGAHGSATTTTPPSSRFGARISASSAPAGAEHRRRRTQPHRRPSPTRRAGTIASFTDGTLTITLNDGSTVSGKVTEAHRDRVPRGDGAQRPATERRRRRQRSGDGNATAAAITVAATALEHRPGGTDRSAPCAVAATIGGRRRRAGDDDAQRRSRALHDGGARAGRESSARPS